MSVLRGPGLEAFAEDLLVELADARLRHRVDEHHVVKWWLPDEVVFIDEVPKTSVGKFDKKVLRTRLKDGELLPQQAVS